MKITIRSFFFFFIIIFFVFSYILYSYSFFQLEEQRAKLILNNLNTSISELSYNISKDLTNIEEIKEKRPLFDRLVANNDFLKAIMVFNDNKLLLSTNPSLKKVDTLIKENFSSNYALLKNSKIITSNIRFYKNKNLTNLLLVYVLEKKEITFHFERLQIDFFINFMIFLVILIITKLLLLQKFVTAPLEKLRQYAYYNSFVPKTMVIKEFEAIRNSMVDSFSRLANEKEVLYNMARTDSLSGLANRNSLNEFLERLIPNSKRDNKEFAYLFLDLDHFKSVNDSLGHNIGDELLQNLSKKVETILRPSDFIARVGGDEFVIIIQNYHNYSELINIIQRIQNYISTPWLIANNPIYINCSIGVSIFPKDGADAISLMKSSDIAMYEAKKLGRNQYHFFTESLNEKVQNIIQLTTDMKEALKNGEFELYYQPKIDINDSQIYGVEALIRWYKPNHGMITPDNFIPLAEENNFIKILGEWIIDEALNQYLIWKEKGIDLKISINISAKQISEKNFSVKLIEKLNNLKIPHEKIDLEITEYMFLDSKEFTNDNLRILRENKISISLDDFGTGYSSLSYLKKYPIDNLKIDKSFLDDFNSKEGSIFLETIVKMAQTLNMKVIAEGVEEEKQLEYLKSIHCDQYQGYYFSKPLNAKGLEELYFRIMS